MSQPPSSPTPPQKPSAWAQLQNELKKPRASSKRIAYPPIRNFVLDLMAEGRRKNTINLAFEADISDARQRLSAMAEPVSITSFVAKSLLLALAENPHMQAYRYGKSELVLFDDVDLSFTVERELDGALLPLAYISRAANRKSAAQLHAELQAAKVAPLGAAGPMSALEKTFFLLPIFIRRLVWRYIRSDPYVFKQLAGTVAITSMGMFVSGAAVMFPITPMTLTLSIGGIEKKLIMIDGLPVEREVIHLNLGADHDIIDGAPLMRFAEVFRKKLEGAVALASPP